MSVGPSAVSLWPVSPGSSQSTFLDACERADGGVVQVAAAPPTLTEWEQHTGPGRNRA